MSNTFRYLDPITEGLTEEEKKRVIDQIAENVINKGLTAPAIMFLESIKPFAKVGSYTFLLFLSPIMGFAGINGYLYTGFFKDRENIERLIKRIEEMSRKENINLPKRNEPSH